MHSDLDALRTLAAVAEMEQRGFVCDLVGYDLDSGMWLVEWQDYAGRWQGFWAAAHTLEKIFEPATIH